VIDPIVDNPPTDVIVVRYRERRPLKKILVPFSGALNSRKALKYAVDMAENCVAAPALVTLLHVLPPIPRNSERIRAENAIDEVLREVRYDKIETVFVESDDLVGTILAQSEGHDLIVLGATEEPVFKNLLVGTMPERVARNAKVTVMMVKRRSSPLHSFVRQAILEPTVPKPLE
jgi:nucleotide-binding universal stress UspA family protein